MPARSYDARHRASPCASSKPRRFIAGLALPTAAAAALTFTATGAAVATSTKTQTVTVSQNATATTTTATATATATAASNARATSAALNDPRSQAIVDNALARVQAASSAARSAERKDLAARERAANQVEQANRLEQAHRWQLPIKDAVQTSDFGWRWGRLHAGEDFGAPIGTDLVSMSTGTVIFAGEESGYGTMVKISYWDGTVSYYAHMSRTSVTNGENVEPGEVVGQSGNSGHSTGPHLHLEMHPDGGAAVDPATWLADHKVDY